MFGATMARAAPYAAYVMDARTGEVLHSSNADTRLHPASLTKMMTLYVVFEAVENGEISLDTKVLISKKAASEQPSKLGLKSGQRIELRYLIRAAAVKSANDAATALGEAISGSEAAFARRMNRTAKAMGMTKTTFKNAHGLTESGHLSTASDMSKLGRHVFYDYPAYYNLFSRISADAGVATVNHTNRRFLKAYKGADGIKTGYTNAAGFNLVASAERGNVRIITTVFGGRSTASRNAKVAELMDLGFRRAPKTASIRKPKRPAYVGNDGSGAAMAAATNTGSKTIRIVTAVNTSLRPIPRPTVVMTEQVPMDAIAASLQDTIEDALREAQDVKFDEVSRAPQARPEAFDTPSETIVLAAVTPEVHIAQETPIVVTRVSNSTDRYWGVTVGTFNTRYQAERALLKTALREMATLDGTVRKAQSSSQGFKANFTGMSKDAAELACRRLSARSTPCEVITPAS
ncbi:MULTISPECIES: D-alanyl-D-alanine carboxypeptidase family protein [Falsihalocynthiibacter]|uniref:D-alanyl-D-alanine carboxypeptidase n=2 Tax=Roseobacteraceae TaxID=2854170 RepID=A0A126V5N5_9RHOB|nr:D-alanyl-D-alanine carboxypeptidase [Falsihalocynthiibacter arcticus]